MGWVNGVGDERNAFRITDSDELVLYLCSRRKHGTEVPGKLLVGPASPALGLLVGGYNLLEGAIKQLVQVAPERLPPGSAL